jgi:5-hydroxyisourate hydrolase
VNVDGKWDLISVEKTNSDGRISFKGAAKPGIYRLQFLAEDYFQKSKTQSFFVTIPVVFQIEDTQKKYHVPLLLNPFGYSTYRGS